MKLKKLSKILCKNNNKSYNLAKAAEELQELSLALTHQINKNGFDNSKNIIEEIGDVEIRLAVIKNYYSSKEIDKRVKSKCESIKNHLKTNKYRDRV